MDFLGERYDGIVDRMSNIADDAARAVCQLIRPRREAGYSAPPFFCFYIFSRVVTARSFRTNNKG
jgi:hypothetical protein